ncbi:MAG: hypothetical protein IPJ82_23810 [Lewinellaceae bacterium]|nr:hypothetical protein [Lewinellaceae bacterium]
MPVTGYRFGNLLFNNKKFPEAVAAIKESSETCIRLTQLYPENSGYRSGWAGLSRAYLSWYLLFDRQPAEALRAALEAIGYDSTGTRAEAYYAHTLLCNGRAAEARRHYLSASIRDDRFQNSGAGYYAGNLSIDSPSIPASPKTCCLYCKVEDSVLATAVREGIPQAREKLRSRKIGLLTERVSGLNSIVSALVDSSSYRAAVDTFLLYIAACRELFALDNSIDNRRRLGRALHHFQLIRLFHQPARAGLFRRRWEHIHCSGKSASAPTWPPDYLLSGEWAKAQTGTASSKTCPMIPGIMVEVAEVAVQAAAAVQAQARGIIGAPCYGMISKPLQKPASATKTSPPPPNWCWAGRLRVRKRRCWRGSECGLETQKDL